MSKILDTFLFTHEFDMLELRLRTLWSVVDKFLLMEGDHNFANKPKAMRFNEQVDRFAWAKDKLIHMQHIGPFAEGNGDTYVENQHRQYLFDTAQTIEGFSDNDIMLISDVDELPSLEVVERLKNEQLPMPFLLKQEFYYYNINCHRGKKWNGTIACRMNQNLNIGCLREERGTLPYADVNTGWHLCHFYDSQGIREKLEHSSHQEYNNPKFYDLEHLKQCVKENKNFLGKKDGELSPEPLPDYLINQLKAFPVFMGQAWE